MEKAPCTGNATVDSHNDHRIAMALAIAAIKCDNPIVLKDMNQSKIISKILG